MAIFRNIHISFWEDLKVQDEMNITERYFWLYLLTNPHTSQIGCYEIGLKQMEYETGIPKTEILDYLKRFEKELNLIKYSEENKELLILNWYKYNLTRSPKMLSYIKKEMNNIKTDEFRYYIDTVCIPYVYGIKSAKKDDESHIDTVGIPYRNNNKNNNNNINNKNNNITKLNYTFYLIINNNSEELKIDPIELQGLKILLKRLELDISADNINNIPEDRLQTYTIIYSALFILYTGAYKYYLNKLTREDLFSKLSKTKEYVGEIDTLDDEGVKIFMSYYVKCLQELVSKGS